MTKVFVYGTLKAGMANHRVLDNSELVIETQTKGRFEMVSFGRFAGVIQQNRSYHILGEVYDVNDQVLQAIDSLECNGTMFDREPIHVEGLKDPVDMYFVNTYHDFLEISENYYDNIKFEYLTQEWNPQTFDFPIK